MQKVAAIAKYFRLAATDEFAAVRKKSPDPTAQVR
jgi:hypothetical protein